ncbi:MAG: DUF3618 domain-containing protein [Nocardioides sp.]
MSNDMSSLERELDETRDRLATTIDQLIHRANPKNIVDRQVSSTKAHFIDKLGKPRTDNITKVAGGLVGFLFLLAIIRKITR